MKTWDVTSDESGLKLLNFLKNRLPAHLSAKQIKKAIEENKCQVNRRVERFASYHLGAGDQVTFNDESSIRKPEISFESNRLLFEDDHLVVYNKSSGIASDNSELLKVVQDQLPQLFLVHRLDRDTTGVLLFAKSKNAFEAMKTLFQKRLINKEYLALVDGLVARAHGVIDNFLAERHRYQGQTLWGSVPKGKGLQAITEWQTKKKGKDCTLLLCKPKTGRTHQLRIHLSEMGHPILGDFQYGKQFLCAYRPARILLHAQAVAFDHPFTGQPVTVEAPIPLDLKEAIEKLCKNI